MREGNQGRHGMPFRRWGDRPRPSRPAQKMSIQQQLDPLATIVPMQVRIEVQSGRDSSSNMIRAYRILKQIEESGGLGRIVEVAEDGSALVAEVDAAQMQSLAGFPFVRRIISMN